MQRWWIAIVAIIGVGLAFFLFPRPDRGASVDALEDPAATADEADAPAFGSRDKVKRRKAKRRPVPPDVIEAQQRLAELRGRPDAQAGAKLIGAWSGVRKTLLESDAEEAQDFAERLRQPLQDLAEFRRNPELGVPFEQIRTQLDELHAEISASPFAEEGHIPRGLEAHESVLGSLDAKELGNGSEESE